MNNRSVESRRSGLSGGGAGTAQGLEFRQLLQMEADRIGCYRYVRWISAEGCHALAADLSLELGAAREIWLRLRDEADDYRALMGWKEHQRIVESVRARIDAWIRRRGYTEHVVPV